MEYVNRSHDSVMVSSRREIMGDCTSAYGAGVPTTTAVVWSSGPAFPISLSTYVLALATGFIVPGVASIEATSLSGEGRRVGGGAGAYMEVCGLGLCSASWGLVFSVELGRTDDETRT